MLATYLYELHRTFLSLNNQDHHPNHYIVGQFLITAAEYGELAAPHRGHSYQ